MHTTTTSSTDRFVQRMADKAPFGLLAMAILALLTTGVFRFSYFCSVLDRDFGNLAIALAVSGAIIFEGVRFFLMLSSARDYVAGNRVGMALGILGSVGMVIYEVAEAIALATYWTAGDDATFGPVLGFIQLCIGIAFLLEVRLVLTLATARRAVVEAEAKAETSAPAPRRRNTGTGNRQRVATPTALPEAHSRPDVQPADTPARIAEAYMAFFQAHNRKPTQRQIAEATGLTERTIRKYWGDINAENPDYQLATA